MSEPARKGKIARLPRVIRDEINRRLLDGEPGSKILPWLNTQETVLRVLDEHFGEEPVTPQNLSEWRQGGYQDWIKRREQVETTRDLAALSLKLAEGMSPTEGAARIAGGQMLLVLESLDIEAQKNLLRQKPETYLSLLDALARVKRAEADAKKAEAAKRTTDQNERRLEQNDRRLALDEAKFQRTTCELFLKWHEDQRAREIADSPAPQAVKMEKLHELIFGKPPAQTEEI
ncbi:hypothetical protein [Geminisphaera colitermitum]|uniref:hypothetical protein n=1 Tax=Geminisphaera colitermitum TaxID=1148786 RepID=UPI000158C729|nr:hypothetical protein [Geminisphaera colitermitum]